MDFGLQGKTVLITGATGGIGVELSKGFLREGARVVAFCRGNEQKIRRWENEVDEVSREVDWLVVSADIEKREEIIKGLELTREKFGDPDILINNAGYEYERPFLMMPEDEIRKQLNINFLGPTFLMQEVMRGMVIRKSGSIVNISTVAARRFGRGISAYASAKSALERLTKILAVEVGRKGIRVNAVAPGLIETRMSQGIILRRGDQIIKEIALERFGKPLEVVNAALFLASDEMASYITGHVLAVDGGIGL